MAKTDKKEKITDLLVQVRKCLDKGSYIFTQHALVRRKERLLVLPDILHVLKNGWHEKKKDIWNKQFGEWDYAIRGVTEDNHHVRVVVSFDEQLELLIITVIKLDKV